MWNWDFFNIFFLKPGLSKTFYFMKYFQFLLFCTDCFMLENFKKNFMIWVVPVTEVLSYLVRLVWSRAVYPRSFPSGHAKLSKFLYHQTMATIVITFQWLMSIKDPKVLACFDTCWSYSSFEWVFTIRYFPMRTIWVDNCCVFIPIFCKNHQIFVFRKSKIIFT